MNSQISSHRTAIRPRSTATTSLPAGAAAQRGGPFAGTAALVSLQAWVWSSSVVPKLTSTTFVHGFAGFVAQGGQAGQSGWYDAILQRVLLAAPSVFAIGAITAELGLGVTFTITAIALLTRRTDVIRPLLGVAAAASAVGAIFAINLAVLASDPAPWHTGSPFDSGVAIEYLIAGLSLAGAVATRAMRRRLAN